jgi:FkbM family methyltransferase
MERLVRKNNVAFTVSGSDDHWNSFENNTWESETFMILDKFLQTDDVMMDIGAWIGPISLYGAVKVKKCYSFEPDPVAYEKLQKNISLNPTLKHKIDVFNEAVTADGQKVRLFSRFNHGDSGSSLLKRTRSTNNYVEVRSTTLADFLKKTGLTKVDFIKMDIEGGEFFVLPQIAEYVKMNRPTLMISFHYAALYEFLELKLLPFGPLRRIYRILDRHKRLINALVIKRFKTILKSFSFYPIYNSALQTIDIENLKREDLEGLDMLLFTERS